MRLIATVLLSAAMLTGATAQSVPLQGGPWSAGHAPMYSNSGNSQPVIMDSGTAAGGAVGANLSELGLTVRGTGTPPYSSQGKGPNGENFCDYDAPITNATGYHYLCLSPNVGGNAELAYGTVGSATPGSLTFLINGSSYQFPAILSGVVGPSSSTVGHVACWNNTSGTLLKDCVLAFSNLTGAATTAQGGVKTGGTTGQVLGKASGTDYDLSWLNVAALNADNGLTLSSTTGTQAVPHVPFAGNFNNASASSTMFRTISGTTTGPAFTTSIAISTVGGNVNGPDHATVPLWINLTKANYLATANDGELDGLYIVGTQGLNGDISGVLVGTYKVQGGANSVLGSEMHAHWTDSSANVTADVSSITSFLQGPGGISATQGIGFYTTSVTGTAYSGFTAISGAGMTNYFTGSPTNTAGSENFIIDSSARITSTHNPAGEYGLSLISNDAGATQANGVRFFRNSASPAANDTISGLEFHGENTSAAEIDYAAIFGSMTDPTAASEDGRISFFTQVAGTLSGRMAIVAGLTLNGAADEGVGTVNVTSGYYVNGTKVLGARNTGWATQTATPAKTDLGAAPTAAQIAQYISALNAALITTGLIGP